ncbi:uncharacterized protein BO66DRAFT_413854 [Aspergillus aculeatinus CBS 121060]|uniref:Uncharacterized protein n=1 Tax=Aspergillus aculeatinus CBS 121060 TaxID=1448322 RepID=A0ACD1H0E3_9EURO|nr:hypothetical protein BO66DRAFT_413854 [Aspergillus aculeatinus CBS 121060]RAH67057.1 hypothetical protein BO66DRAFT_413854 [Aspergillus aculeatinus CBS 121060]
MTNPSLNRDTHLAEKLAALQAHGVSAQSLPTSDDSVLYLAYGSNLNSETFLGMRGIRPLSSTNVVVPSLWLTFDLPGIPYAEPCFAATRYRPGAAEGTEEDRGYHDEEGVANVRSDTDHAPPKETDPSLPLLATTTDGEGEPDYSPRMPLVGVVYEVTLSDYARIIATEGGGRGYIDTVIDCYAFPKTYNPQTDPVPEHPGTVPFQAHTLLSPGAAAAAAAAAAATATATPPTISKSTRPNPFYAQPSARYLGLIRAGAAEHNLPRAYRAYLAGIRPYRITTRRQRVGQVAFLAAWGPVVMGLIGLGRALAGPDGRHPGWLVRAQDAVFGAMWRSYDSFFVRVFGDGERTDTRYRCPVE